MRLISERFVDVGVGQGIEPGFIEGLGRRPDVIPEPNEKPKLLRVKVGWVLSQLGETSRNSIN